jgi:hypothetical protein
MYIHVHARVLPVLRTDRAIKLFDEHARVLRSFNICTLMPCTHTASRPVHLSASLSSSRELHRLAAL